LLEKPLKRKHNNRVITAIIISIVAVIALKVSIMSTLNDFQISRHFNLREFASPDTDEVKIDVRLVIICERLRRELEIPITITSGYRTKAHNKKVGGSKDSYHMKGMAADTKLKGRIIHSDFDNKGYLRKLFIKATKIKGIGGLGWYEDSHIHIDIRKDRLYWVKLKGQPIKYFEHFVGAISYYTAKTMPPITLGGS